MPRLAGVLAAPAQRRIVQLAAGVFVVAAMVAMAADQAVVRVCATGLLAAVALVALKSSLVAHAEIARLGARREIPADWWSQVARMVAGEVDQGGRRQTELDGQLVQLSARLDIVVEELAANRDEVGQLEAVVSRHDARFLPDLEAATLLIRRSEPLLAQVAVIQNELLALREDIERVDRRHA